MNNSTPVRLIHPLAVLEDPSLHSSARVYYSILRSHIDANGCVEIRDQDLAKRLGCSENNVWKLRQDLIAAGLIEVSYRGGRKSLRYQLLGVAIAAVGAALEIMKSTQIDIIGYSDAAAEEAHEHSHSQDRPPTPPAIVSLNMHACRADAREDRASTARMLMLLNRLKQYVDDPVATQLVRDFPDRVERQLDALAYRKPGELTNTGGFLVRAIQRNFPIRKPPRQQNVFELVEPPPDASWLQPYTPPRVEPTPEAPADVRRRSLTPSFLRRLESAPMQVAM